MKRRILCMALVAVLVLALACTAFAAGSKGGSATPGVAGDELLTGAVETAGLPSDVASLINAINSGSKSIQDIPGISVKGKVAVSNVFELYWASGRDKHDGATATLTGCAISAATTGVQVVHYSVTRNTWEVINPTAVDGAAKTVTADFADVSPVIVIADAGATSPATGAGIFAALR